MGISRGKPKGHRLIVPYPIKEGYAPKESRYSPGGPSIPTGEQEEVPGTAPRAILLFEGGFFMPSKVSVSGNPQGFVPFIFYTINSKSFCPINKMSPPQTAGMFLGQCFF
jgi:hypothetical protein